MKFLLTCSRKGQARTLTVENAVEADDELMMRFLEEGEESITKDELKAALRKRVLEGDFFLVTGGDGRGVIVEKLRRDGRLSS